MGCARAHDTLTAPSTFLFGFNCSSLLCGQKELEKNIQLNSFQWKIDWQCYATSCNGPCRSKMTHQDKHYGLSHSEAYVNWKKKICHGKLGQCLGKTLPEFLK